MITGAIFKWIKRCFGAFAMLSMLAALAACDSGPGYEKHMTQARDSLRDGDYVAAVIQLKNALQRVPESGEARELLGQSYVQLQLGSEAEKELLQARKLGQKEETLSHTLARAYLLQNKNQDVLDLLAKPVVDGDSVTRWVLLGFAELGLGNGSKAEAGFKAALEKETDNAEALLGLGRLAMGRGKKEDARHYLERAVELAPANPLILMVKGRFEFGEGAYGAAHLAYAKAWEVADYLFRARLGLAETLLAEKKPVLAAQHFTALSRQFARNPRIKYGLAVAAYQQGDFAEAEKELREILSILPNHPRSMLFMASLHYRNKQYRQAEELLILFLDLQKDNIAARRLLAMVGLKLGQPGRAIEALGPALKQAPKDAQLYAIMGSAHLRHKNFEQATRFFQKAAELDPESAGLHARLAGSYIYLGDTGKAIDALEAAIEIAPQFGQADLLLIHTHVRKKDYDAALVAARRFALKQPNNPVPLNFVGVALEGKGELKAAREAYEKALKLAPEYVTSAMNLGRMDEQAGRREAGRKRYQAILERWPAQADARLGLARMAARDGNRELWLSQVREAHKRNPEAIKPYLLLAADLLRRGATAQGLEKAEEAHLLQPENGEALLLLSRAQLLAGQADAALGTARQLLGQEPESIEGNYHLAQVWKAKGERVQQRVALGKVLGLAPGHLSALGELGGLEVSDGRYKEALKVADTLRKKHPKLAGGETLRGEVLQQTGRSREAMVAFRNAYKLSRNSTTVLGLSRAEYRSGNRSVGIQLLRDWLQDHPKDIRIREHLADILSFSGKSGLAIAEYKKVLVTNSEYAPVLNKLAWLYFQQKDGRAQQMAEQAYRVDSESPEIADTLGWILLQGGEVERGFGLLRKAEKQLDKVRLPADRASIRYHLAVALAQSGNLGGARSTLRNVLDSGQAFVEREDARQLLRELSR